MSKAEVKLIGESLQVGEDSGFVSCPFCRAPHEQKFSVKRLEHGLLYNCFRASCGEGSFIPTGYWSLPDEKIHKKEPKRKPYLGRLHDLEECDSQFFQNAWDIVPRDFKVTDRDEYALPILSPTLREYQRLKGWVIRQPKWKGVVGCPRQGIGKEGYPKALTYKDDPLESKLSWGWTRDYRQHVVLVEDILSAWKVTQAGVGVGVSMNGTTIGKAEVEEICQERPLIVSIWLDPDATDAAYKLQSKYGLAFNFCNIITTNVDPKDVAKEEINLRLREVHEW